MVFVVALPPVHTSTYVAVSCQLLSSVFAAPLSAGALGKVEYLLGMRKPVPFDCLGCEGDSFSNSEAAALGMIPIAEGLINSPGSMVPIVYDLPAPDWPYASKETL